MPSRRLIPGGWSLQPFVGFRGLNLREQPDGLAPGQALDLLNVQLQDHGSLRGRDGYSVFDTAVRDGIVSFLHSFTSVSAGRRLLESTPLSLYAVDTGGAIVHSASGFAGPAQSAARMGIPTGERLYVGMSADTVRRYDTAGFSAPTCTLAKFDGTASSSGAMPKGACVEAWSGEERLVVGGFPAGVTNAGPAGATSSPDHVFFSQNANPESFRDTDFVRLGVGDGQQMQAIVAWRDMVFVFKETKFWVFTNTSAAADGSVTFQRRNVDTGIGAVGRGAVTVGRDGVYFVGPRGIYRTRGGDPELLTSDVEPLWGGALAPYFTGGQILQGAMAKIQLQWLEEQLHMAYVSTVTAGSTPDRVLVVDPRDGRTTLWAMPAAALGVFKALDHDELLFGHGTNARVRRQQRGLVLDDGAPFPGFWFGGFDAPAGDRVIRCGSIGVWGQGTMDIGLAHDYQQSFWSKRVTFGAAPQTWGDGTNPADKWGDGTSSADTWGGLLGITGKLVRRASRGSRFAIRVANSPDSVGAAASWSLNRVTLHFTGDGPRHAAIIKEP